MSYTQNPYMPKVRRDAAHMVKLGFSTAEVGRRYGVGSSTICKWVKKAQQYGYHPIPTQSSKPHAHPHQLSNKVIRSIVSKRHERGACAEVLHHQLNESGINTSLSSVKRTLDRCGLLKKRSPWKRYHPHVDRPYPQKPGDLVEIDTIHLMVNEHRRIYVYVLIDVYSRWVYARAYEKMNGAATLHFVREAQRKASFKFDMLQSDHGPEFGKWFVTQIKKKHRYTRIGKPNDNAHIERFNRTIQEKCIDATPKIVPILNVEIAKYLHYYNHERPHMSLQFKTPMQLLKCVQAIG